MEQSYNDEIIKFFIKIWVIQIMFINQAKTNNPFKASKLTTPPSSYESVRKSINNFG